MVTTTGQHVPQKRYPEDCIEGYRAQEVATATVDPEPRSHITLYNLLETLQVTKFTLCFVWLNAVWALVH